MFNNFSLPTKYQWKRIAVNAVIYFCGTFFALLGFQGYTPTDSSLVQSVDISLSTLLAALAAAGGSTVKFLVALFTASEK